ncbi:MAG TPA: MaoC family dehydratase N-terminal domain-containing protein [Ramlibacter sp.]|nr:MaoC family dehydratase N-terminal domain-containing protein [Ramlibacter sp.]
MNLSEFDSWIGRERTARDEITAFPINALSATLDREDPEAVAGTPVPPLWHWLYFLAIYRPGQMRKDGHLQGGDFMPPLPLPRRVWAGSKFSWNAANPLRVGDQATRVSRIASITSKEGRSGELAFVKLVHEYHNANGLCFTNDHMAAFRGEPKAEVKAEPAAAEQVSQWHRELLPDTPLLFRYSALMFNSHRIHYDTPYAVQEEKYPAILVQGPLLATLLMDLLRRNAPDALVRTLEFKAVRSAFVGRPLHLRGQPDGDKVRLWAADDEGRLVMSAQAELGN